MPDIDSETLERILDPSTNFMVRRRAFEEAMTWARGEGWDACHVAYQDLHGPIDGPPKPDGMVIQQRPVEELEPAPVWSIEEVPVIEGRAVRHTTLPEETKVIRVPVLRS